MHFVDVFFALLEIELGWKNIVWLVFHLSWNLILVDLIILESPPIFLLIIVLQLVALTWNPLTFFIGFYATSTFIVDL